MSDTAPEQDRLVEALLAVLDARGWDYDVQDDDADEALVIRLVHHGVSGTWASYVRVDPGAGRIAVHSVFPRDAPAPTRDAVIDLLGRVNDGLAVCAFAVDPEDGEIVLGSSLTLDEGDRGADTVDLLLRADLAAMDRWFRPLDAVVGGRLSAEDAYRAGQPDVPSG